MLLKELKTVIAPGEDVVILDRFSRTIERCPFGEISEYLMQADIQYLTYSSFYGCVTVKVRYGKFE